MTDSEEEIKTSLYLRPYSVFHRRKGIWKTRNTPNQKAVHIKTNYRMEEFFLSSILQKVLCQFICASYTCVSPSRSSSLHLTIPIPYHFLWLYLYVSPSRSFSLRLTIPIPYHFLWLSMKTCSCILHIDYVQLWLKITLSIFSVYYFTIRPKCPSHSVILKHVLCTI